MVKVYYQDELVTIYHGDCRELLPSLPKVDLVLTDPPYDVSTHSKHLSSVVTRQELQFDSIDSNQLLALSKGWLGQCKGWIVFTCDWHHMLALESTGCLIRFGVWIKPNAAPQFTGDRPAMGWEPVAVMHHQGRKTWNGGGQHGVWTIPIVNEGHPTQKPVRLYAKWIELFSAEGDLILDPFMGSGTTLVAAKQLQRHAIGIEIEERYCEIAARRCEMAQESLFAPKSEPQQEPQEQMFA